MSCCCKSGNPLSQQQWKPGHSSGPVVLRSTNPRTGWGGREKGWELGTLRLLPAAQSRGFALRGAAGRALGHWWVLRALLSSLWAPFKKISPAAELLVLSSPLGSHWHLLCPDRNNFSAVSSVLAKAKLPTGWREKDCTARKRICGCSKPRWTRWKDFLAEPSDKELLQGRPAAWPRALPAGGLSTMVWVHGARSQAAVLYSCLVWHCCVLKKLQDRAEGEIPLPYALSPMRG